jgi:putative chitinase
MSFFSKMFGRAQGVAKKESTLLLTETDFRAIFPRVTNDWYPWILAALERYDISTPQRIAHFLSQIGHESGGLTRLDEDLHYSKIAGIRATWPQRFLSDAAAQPFVANPEALAERVYNTEVDGRPGRKDLGNTQPGDGWLFRGRGLIQVTGRDNFARLAKAFGLTSAEDAVAFARSHEGAALSAGDYWDRRRINALADTGGLAAVPTVTRAINSKLIGLADRQQRFQQAAKVLGV